MLSSRSPFSPHKKTSHSHTGMVSRKRNGNRRSKNPRQGRTMPNGYVTNPGPRLPPSLRSNLSGSTIIRYVNTSNTVSAVACTAIQLLDLFFVATSATVGYRIMNAIRLEKVSIWVAPFVLAGTSAPVFAPTQVELNFESFSTDGPAGPASVYSDTCMNVDDTAHICVKPPAGSAAAQWLGANSTNQLFSFTIEGFGVASVNPLSAVTVIDLELSYVVNSDDSPDTVSRAILLGTVGQLYAGPFSTSGAGPWKPVGYETA